MKVLVFTFAIALCGAAFAEGADCGAPRPEGGRARMGAGVRGGEMGMPADPILRAVSNRKLVEKLGLADEQKSKLEAVMRQSKESRDLQARMREAMKRQVSLLEAEKVDEAAVMAAIDELFDLRKQMAKSQAKRVIAVKAILTPEQIAKARSELGSQKPPRNARRRGPAGGERPAAPPEAK